MRQLPGKPVPLSSEKGNNDTGRCCVEKGARTRQRDASSLAGVKLVCLPTDAWNCPRRISYECVWIAWILMDEPDTQLAFSEGQQITDMFEQTLLISKDLLFPLGTQWSYMYVGG